MAHADGRVSRQYLRVCGANGVDLLGAKIGTELHVTSDYFEKSYECLLEIGYKLGQVLWRKVFPRESNDADSALISTTLDLIKKERYGLALGLLRDFLLQIPGKDRRLSARVAH